MKNSVMVWNLKLAAMTVAGFFISVLLVSILSPILLVFWIYAKFIYFLIWVKIGDTFTRPEGKDIYMGMESYESGPFIQSIIRYKGKIDIARTSDKILTPLKMKDEKGQIRYKKFTQVFEQMYGYHIFKDAKDFDILNHVKEVKLEELFPEKFKSYSSTESKPQDDQQPNGQLRADEYPNGDLKTVDMKKEINTKADDCSNHKRQEGDEANSKLPRVEWELVLERLLNKYGGSKIPPGLPQWQVLMVEENGYHSVLFQLNHSICDGINFLRFLSEHLYDEPVEYKLPYNYRQPTVTRKFLDYFLGFCLLPFGIAKTTLNFEKNPLHGPELSGEKMFLASTPITMETVKSIKRHTQTSVNAVFFDCMSNAIATHFRKKKCLVENVVVMFPFSLHNLSKPIKLRNESGLSNFRLPTFIDKRASSVKARNPSSAVARLQEVQESYNRAKGDRSMLSLNCMFEFVCSILPSSITFTLFKAKGMTTTLSNVVDSSNDKMRILGCRKCDWCFFLPDRSPMGMGVSISGLGGNRIRVGLTVDRVLMGTEEEGYEFLESFREEIVNLAKEIRSGDVLSSLEFEDYSRLMTENIP